jgi:hypothetical protein
MAKKRKKLTRRQRKEQQRAAMARVRKERGWQSPPSQPIQANEVLDDALHLFPEIGDRSAQLPPPEQLMMALVDSAELADEPEFEEILVEPLLCTATFVKVGEELGHDPDALLELPEEEREDVHIEMLVETIQQLLTDELRQEILDGLDKLRSRLKQAGRRKEAARAAVMQSFLSEMADSQMWALIGLVQSLFHRSVFVGFDMIEASAEVWEAEEWDEEPPILVERLAQSSLERKAESLLNKVPGFSEYLSRQADTTWEEGVKAVFDGELYLGLFLEEELVAGLDLFRQSFGGALEEAISQELDEVEMSGEAAEDFLSRVDDHVAGLLTPERLDQMRARLDVVLKERTFEYKWFPFVYLLTQYMAESDAAKNEIYFLNSAFLGEFQYVGKEITEANS